MFTATRTTFNLAIARSRATSKPSISSPNSGESRRSRLCLATLRPTNVATSNATINNRWLSEMTKLPILNVSINDFLSCVLALRRHLSFYPPNFAGIKDLHG